MVSSCLRPSGLYRVRLRLTCRPNSSQVQDQLVDVAQELSQIVATDLYTVVSNSFLPAECT